MTAVKDTMARNRQGSLPGEDIGDSMPIASPALFLHTAITLVALIMLASLLLDRFTPNFGYQLIQEKSALVERLSEPADIVVLGDSSGNQSVDTDYLTNELGISSINLATIADATIIGNLIMLNSYIKKFGPPKCVVMVHTYDVWQRDAAASVISQFQMPTLEILAGLAEVELRWDKIAKVLFARLIPPAAENRSLRQLLMYPWDLNADTYSLTDTGYMHVAESDAENVERDLNEHLDDLSEKSVSLSEINERALNSLVSTAEKHGFLLFVVNSPIFRELYDSAAFRRYYDKVNDEIKSVLDGSKYAFHRFDVPQTFSANELSNVDHLTGEAPQIFTHALVDEVNCLRTPL